MLSCINMTISCVQISGLGCVAVGIWMHADKDIEAYLTVLRRNPRDHALVSGASLLIAAGFLMVIFAVIGFYAVAKRNKLLLRLVSSLKACNLWDCYLVMAWISQFLQ